MPNNCQHPEMCLLSETCVPCAICPNAKEKADDRLALTPCSPSSDTPETKDAYQQRDGEGAMAHEIRRAQTMEKLERERDEARGLVDRLAALLQRNRDGYGGQMVVPECGCCDCKWLQPIDEALAACKEARSES